MAIRVKFKSLVVLAATTSFCLVIFNVSSPYHPTPRPQHTRIARITAKDLLAIRHTPDDEGVIPQPMNTVRVLNTSPHALLNASQAAASSCGNDCQSPQNRSKTAGTQLFASVKALHQKKQQNNDTSQHCGRACRLNRLRKKGLTRHSSYVSRVQVENVTLPGSWTVTRELVDRLSQRQRHVQETCRKYGLDKANKTYQPNAWEFLINEEYNLVWCNVFKAASSTWFYNFNLLAGFSEFELLHSKESPVTLARKRYKRPRVEDLMAFLSSGRPTLTFMIVRHPLERLVSGYRDKILSGNRYYSKLSRTIAKSYPGLTLPAKEREWKWPRAGRPSGSMVVASFPQFVQFLLDETAKKHKLDEHWTPSSSFCTPCLVPFDVFAKVETLQEDGNYIAFSSGINHIIKPKRINRSRDAPTKDVTNKFLCQLSNQQMEGLIQLYKLDLEMFQYDVSNYRECAGASNKTRPA